MSNGAAVLKKNLTFWHWYPKLLVEGLTVKQLRWQPEQHDTSIMFALWHAYRAEDELLHGIVMGRPSVFVAQGWAARLPVEKTGATPFGNGLCASAEWRDRSGRARGDGVRNGGRRERD